ncbi:MAG: hypothetical protein LBM98_07560 [Oscillospiraceae bacterium]|nr:hypothetical protein [Oscillospiraceae bacterium]
MRAAVSSRYVPLRPARQSSAAVRRYVCYAPGTGLLRACNALRITSAAALAKTAHCAGTWAGRGYAAQGAGYAIRATQSGRGKPRPYTAGATRDAPPQPPSKPSSLIFDI